MAAPSDTGLPTGSASVVYGEACLSLETDQTKARIIAEAARLLRPGGRLGLHELLLTPDDLDGATKRRIGIDLSKAVRVGARPLTRAEWVSLVEAGGFAVTLVQPAPMLLPSPRSVLRDEGVRGTCRILLRSVASRVVLRRIVGLWHAMHRERRHLGAVAIVAVRRWVRPRAPLTGGPSAVISLGTGSCPRSSRRSRTRTAARV